eukprot:CAMPEP_0117451810 /NCGR_PEP_ID=MMETSP0759-20121206/9220_1 /TAXON_ID=63605 /ORGANISM="Percolomonas cosmopolitus, Strain WS" /LENGTH=410 /DNA_ID=CAMNT_0005244463 /DNA_START=98 /DNA_END=1327 /DNA_ORIENTATION=-
MSLSQKDEYEQNTTNIITTDLLRKRSEHNDGQLSTLEEVTLHQYNIIEISPVLHEKCRMLKILFLQNNLIEKLENLHHLKSLEYLNMAVNSVQRIENLESLESLNKLDLTVNYIGELSTVKNLKSNYNLKELFLMGNPCCVYKHYRLYVILHLPQLQKLDGKEISKSERIEAQQLSTEINETVDKEERDWLRQQKQNEQDRDDTPKYNEKGELVYGNDPQSRKAAALELQKEQDDQGFNREKSVDASKIGEIERLGQQKRKVKRLTPEEEIEKYGHVLQCNEGKWKFKLLDDEQGNITLEVPVGRFLSTAHIDIDLQPTYVRLNVKGKLLQLRLESEIDTEKSSAQRNKTNGNLKLTMPKSGHVQRHSTTYVPSIAAAQAKPNAPASKESSDINTNASSKPFQSTSLRDE